MNNKLTPFEESVKRDFDNQPGKTAFMFEGFRNGELMKRVAGRDMHYKKIELDGYCLDQLRGVFNIVCPEDIDDLIEFLKITRYCWPPQTTKP